MLNCPGGEPALLLSKALVLYRHHDVHRDPRGDLEARLLWDIGEAVNCYIDRIFAGGLLCPRPLDPVAPTEV